METGTIIELRTSSGDIQGFLRVFFTAAVVEPPGTFPKLKVGNVVEFEYEIDGEGIAIATLVKLKSPTAKKKSSSAKKKSPSAKKKSPSAKKKSLNAKKKSPSASSKPSE